MSEPIDPSATPRRVAGILAVGALALAVIALFVESPPHFVLDKADLVGFGICHRIPARSFFIAGRQLPLCARCTGTFLGALLGLAAILVRRRHRASNLPPAPVLLILLAFMALWAFDGLNSFMGLIPGAPQLYRPQNWLRLTTGVLNGLTLSAFVFPILSFTLWREPDHRPVIKNVGELAAILPVAGVLIWIVQAQIDALLYPLAVLSSGGVLVLLTGVNAMIAAVVLRLDNRARRGRQIALPLAAGLALALVEITALGLLRAYLTLHYGLNLSQLGS